MVGEFSKSESSNASVNTGVPTAARPLFWSLGIMTDEHCVQWDGVTGIVSPCADISFVYDQPDEVTVTMHFSCVKGLPSRDLVLSFSGAISARWESESFGLNTLPDTLPKCGGIGWESWTFPLLKIENSSWLKLHVDCHPDAAEGRVHFALVTMNDLFQVLALPTVITKWIDVD